MGELDDKMLQLEHFRELEKAILAAIRDEPRTAQLARFYALLHDVQERLREMSA